MYKQKKLHKLFENKGKYEQGFNPKKFECKIKKRLDTLDSLLDTSNGVVLFDCERCGNGTNKGMPLCDRCYEEFWKYMINEGCKDNACDTCPLDVNIVTLCERLDVYVCEWIGMSKTPRPNYKTDQYYTLIYCE